MYHVYDIYVNVILACACSPSFVCRRGVVLGGSQAGLWSVLPAAAPTVVVAPCVILPLLDVRDLLEQGG